MGKFKLQTVLDYRERLERLAQQEHTAAQQKEGELLNLLAEKRLELAALHEEFESQQQLGLSPQEFVLYSHHIDHTLATLAALVEQWEAAREELERRRQALCKASQERKLLEKLKEKHRLEEQALARHKEAIQLDEIAVQHFKR
jgi:flagellar FliJ protein